MESHITTPEAVELQQHLRNALDCGIEYAEMEVSSQALKYHRVDDMRFDAAIFLNISEDHISPIEHEDFEDYFTSKMRMFAKADRAFVNLDADHIERILTYAKDAKEYFTFSTKNPEADFYAYNIRKDGHETLFSVKCADFRRGVCPHHARTFQCGKRPGRHSGGHKAGHPAGVYPLRS